MIGNCVICPLWWQHLEIRPSRPLVTNSVLGVEDFLSLRSPTSTRVVWHGLKSWCLSVQVEWWWRRVWVETSFQNGFSFYSRMRRKNHRNKGQMQRALVSLEGRPQLEQLCSHKQGWQSLRCGCVGEAICEGMVNWGHSSLKKILFGVFL